MKSGSEPRHHLFPCSILLHQNPSTFPQPFLALFFFPSPCLTSMWSFQIKHSSSIICIPNAITLISFLKHERGAPQSRVFSGSGILIRRGRAPASHPPSASSWSTVPRTVRRTPRARHTLVPTRRKGPLARPGLPTFFCFGVKKL